MVTFGDINSDSPRRLANHDAAFVIAVTDSAAAPVEQRPAVIQAKLEEFKETTALYTQQWLRITSSENHAWQYISDKTHSQHAVDELSDAWRCAVDIRETNDDQKPVPFNIPETITILCDWYDNARCDEDNEAMTRIDTTLKLLKRKYGSDEMPYEYKLDLNVRYTY